MTKRIFCLLVCTYFAIQSSSQYADLGVGALKDKIWWFDWNGFNFVNGATRNFTTADGLNVTVTFSNFSGPAPYPSVMNTWVGSVLYYLYDFSNTNINPAIYSGLVDPNIHFDVTVSATRNGAPTPFTLVAADAEATSGQESIILHTTGSSWQTIDFFRNSTMTNNPLAGCNTQTATITNTWANVNDHIGQNPVIATTAPNTAQVTLTVDLNRVITGASGIALGLFSPVDRGDLPPSYQYVQHALSFTYNNPCNYLPPLPSLTQSTSLRLGSVAGDADGAESSDDNATGVADEDAITSFQPYDGSGNYSVTVPLTNTTGNSATLAAWLDINRDGVFQNTERATAIVPSNNTFATLVWSGLPAHLPTGSVTKWAFRFRLSSDAAAVQNPSGYAPDGEVEDYLTDVLQNTTVNFSFDDTVCVNVPLTLTNSSTNYTTAYWNFCVANINSTPGATNLGNIGNQFQIPVFLDYAQYNGNWYGFMTNNTPGKLTRLDFGNSLLNTPTAVDLGNVGGTINDAAEGIQVVFNEGHWYAIIVGGNSNTGGSRIMKIDFGTDLTNTSPIGTNWGNIGNLNYPGDLHLFNDNGNWYAFTVDANSSVIRFSFGTSFVNPPTAVNFGNVGGALNYSNGIYVINDNGQWYGFVTSRNNSTITRLNFGSSLLNTPTGTPLGNPGNLLNLPRDIYLMKFCNELVGFVVNEGSNAVVKLNFSSITAIPSATSLGNIGNLSFPHSISKIFRVGPDLFTFIPNASNNTLTRLNFSGCSNSSIPNYSGGTPPPITYSTPGVYNINLTIDDGLPTQASMCKQIVVRDCGSILHDTIINNYTEVLAFDRCTNKLTLGDATAYNVGDTVMLIQMKGAIVDSSVFVTFGNVTDRANAGMYEFNYIKSKTGNVVELKNLLIRSYDIPVGKVQLIRVPYLTNAVMTGNVTCLPWDGNKGGVVVLNVRDTLTSVDGHGPDASYKGFRAGIDPLVAPSQVNCYQNNYYYPPNSDLASGKGEGAATVSSGKSFGRGHLANGGGSGNSLNSGGGGGGAGLWGGVGGFSDESAPCNLNAPFPNKGIGGADLGNYPYNIFMGGGGGAGHNNNATGFQANGGNGGGIVIISAPVYAGIGSSHYVTATSLGQAAPECTSGGNDCKSGMGGGGAGGTILLNIDSYKGTPKIDTRGGNGANMSAAGLGRCGPGGGGAGGIVWYKQTSTGFLPSDLIYASAGGAGGVNSAYSNDPWGAEAGQNGRIEYGLILPVASEPFAPNIDSARIKDTAMGCSSFDLKGFGYVKSNPIASWYWDFGDGNFANTQNTSHTYTVPPPYVAKLVVTDVNGCKDSIMKNLTPGVANDDFNYEVNACNPLTVQFHGIGHGTQNPTWTFGDATNTTGNLNPVHTYPSQNDYTVTYSVVDGVCSDTIVKTISLAIIPDDIIRTADTTICFGSSKKLLTKPALNFCWSPTTYLDDPASPNPTTSTPQDIMYYYTAQVTGNNLIVNGDCSQGNTGFTSGYQYNPASGINEGMYNVGSSITAWHPSLSPCHDHTSGTGNLMMVNGDDHPNTIVWSETVTVQPNTNYAFSAWLQHITTINPATLQFSINGKPIGNIFQANSTSCIWDQFYTLWNSGGTNTAIISVINQNLLTSGNDFALDDISFAPVFIKRDSVRIIVEKPVITASGDVTQCVGTQVQLSATGAATYTWSPPLGLTDATIANPIASPATTTQYIVSGTTANGCVAKDTVNFSVNPKPTITISNNVMICKNSSTQLSAAGGVTYSWSPVLTLNDPNIANPIASPTTNTQYFVTVTDNNSCTNIDSVAISIRPDPVFNISPPMAICNKDSVRLVASGGDTYAWQPDPSLSNGGIANPVASPQTTTTYSVLVTESTCNVSSTVSTTVTVNPLPTIQASKSTDLDCSNDRSQLTVSGGTKYLWSPSATLSNPGVSNPIATPRVSTLYRVKGTDALGCSNYDSVLVGFAAVNASGYFMPNAFTPNHDGLNDCYGIRFWGVIQELEFSIYNRWGERIFFTKNPNDCWDGTYKGVPQDPAVFVYMIKAKTICGDTFKKGFFTLIR